MTFSEKLDLYSVEEVMEAIKVPKRTCYDWMAGQSSPPGWAQDLVIAKLEEVFGKRKKKSGKESKLVG